MMQLRKHICLGFRPKNIFFRSALSHLTKILDDMREPQHEPAVEIGKTKKITKLC